MITTKKDESRDVLGPLRPGEQDLVFVDALTGLYNRRLFSRILEDTFAELVSLAGSFALVIIDLDLFKDVNDRYGHLSGDEVLRETAGLLRRTFRESDFLFRYGGDEFVILLPGASASEAEALGRRAREAMHAHEFFDPEETSKIDVPLTFSIGVAAWPGDGDSGRDVLASADERLYAEKRLHVAARARKRMVATGVAVAFAVMVLAMVIVMFLESRSDPAGNPVAVMEPAATVEASEDEADRGELLREIAELQHQIELLRATRPEVPSVEHGGTQIVELERKVFELTRQLEERAVKPEERVPVVNEPVAQVPAAEPVRRPPPKTEAEKVARVSPPVVVPPRLKNRVVPQYPPFAKQKNIEATIDLDVLVDESGRVTEATVVGKPVGFGFEEAARQAVFASQWSPASRDGVAIPMRTTLQVRFQIAR
jgi:TonB family protein